MIIDEAIACFKASYYTDKRYLPTLNQGVLIKSQNVANYIFQENRNEKFDVHKDFPIISPPWKKYFVNWKFPKWIYSDELGMIDVSGNPTLEFCTFVDSFVSKEHETVMRITNFVKYENDMRLLGSGALRCDSTGKAIVEVDAKGNRFSGLVSCPGTENKELVNAAYHNAYLVVAMTNCFCNCKNVTKIENHIPSALIRRRSRDNKYPLTKYYTLKISTTTDKPIRSKNFEETERSLHICRGHFKRFTLDNPLFGKTTGTYWWSMHTRGNKESGEIVKDYEIKLPKGLSNDN